MMCRWIIKDFRADRLFSSNDTRFGDLPAIAEVDLVQGHRLNYTDLLIHVGSVTVDLKGQSMWVGGQYLTYPNPPVRLVLFQRNTLDVSLGSTMFIGFLDKEGHGLIAESPSYAPPVLIRY